MLSLPTLLVPSPETYTFNFSETKMILRKSLLSATLFYMIHSKFCFTSISLICLAYLISRTRNEASGVFRKINSYFLNHLDFSLDPEVKSLIPDGVIRVLDGLGLELSIWSCWQPQAHIAIRCSHWSRKRNDIAIVYQYFRLVSASEANGITQKPLGREEELSFWQSRQSRISFERRNCHVISEISDSHYRLMVQNCTLLLTLLMFYWKQVHY